MRFCGSWSTTGHTEQQLVNFINRLKMKHLKEELPPVPGAILDFEYPACSCDGLRKSMLICSCLR